MVKLPKDFDFGIWKIELAIKEHQRPDTDALIRSLKDGRATPLIYEYLANLNRGQPFKGRKPIKIDKIRKRMDMAAKLIRAEKTRALRSGETISTTEALNRASKRPNGIGRKALWQMVTLYKAHYDVDEI